MKFKLDMKDGHECSRQSQTCKQGKKRFKGQPGTSEVPEQD